MRLNLGSGPHATPGWICIDRSPSIVLDRIPFVKRILHRVGLLSDAQAKPWDRDVRRHDIRRLPYPDASVEAVYSSHALEHIYLAEARSVLAESYRVLRFGGFIRLALPDSEAMARDLLAGSAAADPDAGRVYNSRLLAFPEARPGLYVRLQGAMGGHIHRWQPTRSHVKQLLEGAGFQNVNEHAYREGEMPGVADVETRPTSFFLEATKL